MWYASILILTMPSKKIRGKAKLQVSMMEMLVKDILVTESPQESFTNLSTKA